MSDDPFAEIRQLLAEHDASQNGDGTHFKAWKPSELLSADLTFEWFVKGMLCANTHGADGGEMKTLKSYIGLFRIVALASGTPMMQYWHVPKRQRVLAFVGEGGRIPHTRRLNRVLEACGIEPEEIEDWLTVIYDVAPLGSPLFVSELDHHLRAFKPGFVSLDPVYAYQPTDVDSYRLAAMGGMLARLQHMCEDAEAIAWLTAHFNQSGTGIGLKRFTGAGVPEWVDSWTLLSHRETADVNGGRFRLRMEIGSRQWGGGLYDVDINLGRFDNELGLHDGPITFAVRPPGTTPDTTGDKSAARELKARNILMATFKRARASLLKTDAIERSKGEGVAEASLSRTFEWMIADNTIVLDRSIPAPKGGRELHFYSLHKDLR